MRQLSLLISSNAKLNKCSCFARAVAEALVRARPCPVEFVGLEDVFGESGEPDELAEKYRLTAPHIAAAAKRALKRKRHG